jgi:hypothetical protein
LAFEVIAPGRRVIGGQIKRIMNQDIADGGDGNIDKELSASSALSGFPVSGRESVPLPGRVLFCGCGEEQPFKVIMSRIIKSRLNNFFMNYLPFK